MGGYEPVAVALLSPLQVPVNGCPCRAEPARQAGIEAASILYRRMIRPMWPNHILRQNPPETQGERRSLVAQVKRRRYSRWRT